MQGLISSVVNILFTLSSLGVCDKALFIWNPHEHSLNLIYFPVMVIVIVSCSSKVRYLHSVPPIFKLLKIFLFVK